MGAGSVIPQGRLSTTAAPAALLHGDPQPTLRESRHRGGVALQDPSQGLNVRTWICTTDGASVFLRADGVPQTTLFSAVGVSEVSLAFDQNMNPFVAFFAGGQAQFRWWDTALPGYVITLLPAGSSSPRACLDDIRLSQTSVSDIILAYIRAGVLHYRQQRDRYGIEYTLATGVSVLNSVSMGQNLRLHFDVDGGAGTGPWRLGHVVQEVCASASLPARHVLMRRGMHTDTVEGFATSPEYSAAEAIRALSHVAMFDVQEADGFVAFVRRGQGVDAVLDESEFVDGESGPETDTTRDSIDVPRLLHLTYFDINGGQGPDKQFSERQISPRAEAPTVLNTPMVLTQAQAAAAVAVQHRVMEEELRGELVFGVSDQYLRIVVASVIEVRYRGRAQRCRVTKVEMMDGWQRITAVRDRESAYAVAGATPLAPSAPTPPPSTIPGPTRLALLDIPALSQAGDVLSYHAATSGEGTGWRGAVIERQEAGAQWAVLATDGAGTVIGTLTSALPLASEWYPDETNGITVQLARTDDSLASVSTQVWLSRGNAAAILRADGTAEIVQFRNAVETTPGVWRLTGLQRGRLNSGASAHAIGAVFVLLDGALPVQAGSERLAQALPHRAYSVGNDASTAVARTITWTGRSQREWPPVIDSASRVGDTLTVTWVPRHRFGSEEAPVASSHFDGWRIEASSGANTVAFDTLTSSASLSVAGFANPITVTVRGRNRLAGLGDSATRIVQ